MTASLRFIIMMVLGVVLLAGCTSLPATQTHTFPTSSLAAPARTSTPIPASATPPPSSTSSPTPDPVQAQLDLLYRSSLQYLADTNAETAAVARSLGVSEGMTGRSVCGPLAFAILRDAGLVSRSINLHDYWFLNPPEDLHILEQTFPRDAFEWFSMDTPINEIDYAQFPLKAGDLLFIRSGKRGDYSHVLLVTRLDESGRPYSVTNNYTADGFVIQEYMLYDPAKPGAGIFYVWTDPAYSHLGLTGFGGFDLWRPKALPYTPDSIHP